MSCPSLGLVTKTKVCKGLDQEWSMGVTFHAPKSVRGCEGMNPHTPKWAPTSKVGVPMDFQIFRRPFQGSKFIEFKFFVYHWKALESYMFKMGSHDPFEYLKHKLWPKEGLWIILQIWLSTIKSQESPWFKLHQMACHISLESIQLGL
jgi:hypothetical protein